MYMYMYIHVVLAHIDWAGDGLNAGDYSQNRSPYWNNGLETQSHGTLTHSSIHVHMHVQYLEGTGNIRTCQVDSQDVEQLHGGREGGREGESHIIIPWPDNVLQYLDLINTPSIHTSIHTRDNAIITANTNI